MNKFSVICSYENLPQDIFDVLVPGVIEHDVLPQILDTLDIEKVKEIRKMSLCQIVEDESDALEWIIESDGKYFFPNMGFNLYLEKRLSSV